MSAVNLNGPCPAPHRDRRGEDCYPVDGPAVVVLMRGLNDRDGNPRADRLVLGAIGAGRDGRENEAIQKSYESMARANGAEWDITFFDSVIEAHEAFPKAEGSSLERGIIAGHEKRSEAGRLAKEWLDGIAASGREVCDRCGGIGGASQWPGFTCFKCNGAGSIGSAS